MPLLPQSRADAVAADGLPRQAAADDGSVHVLYLDGATVRSVPASEWPPPLPADPSAAERAAAIAARQAAADQAAVDAHALRQRIVTVAQSAAGQSIDSLTAAQVRALVAVLLWQAGGLTSAGAVRPLSEWARP